MKTNDLEELLIRTDKHSLSEKVKALKPELQEKLSQAIWDATFSDLDNMLLDMDFDFLDIFDDDFPSLSDLFEDIENSIEG